MKLHLIIGRDGRGESTSLLPDRAHRVYMTREAQQLIYSQMVARKNVCIQCGLICRSHELVNEMCGEGIGCHVDVDASAFYAPKSQTEHEYGRSLVSTIWRSFAEDLAAGVGREQVPPRSSEGGDVEW